MNEYIFLIGLHPDIIENTETPYSLVSEDDIVGTFPSRKRFSHKGTYGHALLIAGSQGKMGAAVLSAQACLRSGAGLITTHIPKRGELIMQTSFPEAMLSLDENKEHFSSFPDLNPYTAIGIGPGLGQNSETFCALEKLIQACHKPLVLDADALNIIAANESLMKQIPAHSILTPHPKEFDRLTDNSDCDYERLIKAQNFAMEHEVNVVLKGAFTATCTASGNIYFNNSGNPGIATAGSGDVLTGIILGLLTQGLEPEVAAIAGVFLHGTAGDLASAFHSEESMIASDIIEMIGKAFKQLK